jgi:large subunit ribosomal protein L4
MNRKERRLALSTALAGRVNDMIVVEDFNSQLATPRTKDLVAALTRWGIESRKKTLIITDRKYENIELSARNVRNLVLITADQLNVFDIVNAHKVIVTVPALDKINSVYTSNVSEKSQEEVETNG